MLALVFVFITILTANELLNSYQTFLAHEYSEYIINKVAVLHDNEIFEYFPAFQ